MEQIVKNALIPVILFMIQMLLLTVYLYFLKNILKKFLIYQIKSIININAENNLQLVPTIIPIVTYVTTPAESSFEYIP